MQKESAAEIELNLKKRARRRLVGAIALVMMMMLILPFVLKDRKAPTADEQVKITIGEDVLALSAVNKQALPQAGFDSSVVPIELGEEKPPVDLPRMMNNDSVQVASLESKKPAVGQVEVAPAIGSSVVAEKKVDTATKVPLVNPPKVDNVIAPASIQDKEKMSSPQDKKGAFFVQVGVFSDPENVKKLQAMLSDLGYQSKIEKISTPKGEKIRLKTMTFATRNEAADALEGIKNAGLPGMVVSQ